MELNNLSRCKVDLKRRLKTACRHHSVVLSIFVEKEQCYGPDLELLQLQPFLVHSLPMKSRKRFAHDVFETFTTHANLIRDIVDTDCQALSAALMVVVL